ncbi:FAD-dependent monooxygenase [Geomicrobium sp. JCM 19039]|uniref:FAD-dependent monooxygenase n=1 Tax=Geomicrobium sp. JCM 19039 TaxID=1460636 RepID=UPI00045F3EB9|nr:FAD-dependent monooxygenase [Geomicrobium sp. JCM 19039]GAK12180.1 putative N-hydroxybenzoate hydroxylase [Geomicrobium sp. JCM 19039]
MAQTTETPLLVIGGGIGGLATALGIAQSGRKLKVLEQAPEFGEVGAGIQLAANATNVLQRLGVMEEIKKVSVFPKRLVMMDAFSGEELSALNLGKTYEERYGAPYIVLHRSDLHRVLLDACIEHPNVALETNQKVTNVEDYNDGVTVTTASGSKHHGEALVGADGIWSEVRRLFSDDQPICSAYVAYRGAIPINEVKQSVANMDDVFMWIGPNLHLVQYPVRKGELYNQVVVFKSESYRPEIEHTYNWGTPEEMDKVFDGACEKVKKAISFISRQRRWPMYDREPITNWTKGNVTLLGDSAHAMLQYLAQGACQALEDADCLKDMFEEHDDVNIAFIEYEKERIPRTTYVQQSARTWGEIIHSTQPESILLRDTIMKKRAATDFEFIDQYHGHHRFVKV